MDERPNPHIHRMIIQGFYFYLDLLSLFPSSVSPASHQHMRCKTPEVALLRIFLLLCVWEEAFGGCNEHDVIYVGVVPTS